VVNIGVLFIAWYTSYTVHWFATVSMSWKYAFHYFTISFFSKQMFHIISRYVSACIQMRWFAQFKPKRSNSLLIFQYFGLERWFLNTWIGNRQVINILQNMNNYRPQCQYWLGSSCLKLPDSLLDLRSAPLIENNDISFKTHRNMRLFL